MLSREDSDSELRLRDQHAATFWVSGIANLIRADEKLIRAEIWGSQFQLPELGPLGANGLANARDFLHPIAKYEIEQESWEIVYKLAGKFFVSKQEHSPFDVVAWHGNYVPYKYDLTKFVNVGSISVDHIDPSIFCVITAPSRDPAAPLADFLIFSPRWDVASHSKSSRFWVCSRC